MRILRSTRKCFLYFIFCTCSQLIIFVCIFKMRELPTSKYFSNTTKEEQTSTTNQRNKNKNDYSDVGNDSESLFSTNGMIPKKSRLDGNIGKPTQNTDSSFLKVETKGRSTTLNNLRYLLPNVSQKDGITSFNKNDGNLSKNYLLLATQNTETINMDHINSNGQINLQLLVDILDKKLNSISLTRKIKKFKPTCESDFKLANSCDNNKCLQKELPENLTTRIEQLVVPRRLQMSLEEHVILHEMADEVVGSYDIILLTAASSNHFLESQALLKNLHENVYPYLKNFTLIFYNLGLTEHERSLMIKNCKCQVKDFPFHKFPPFMTSLTCYTWKPVLIKAHLLKANIVFWMDASVRFYNSSMNINKLIQITRERGIQIAGTRDDSTFRSDRSMYHFFGDEPCAFLRLSQAESGLGIYHREYFVDRVILEPWVACALNNNCMCLENKANSSCELSKRMARIHHRNNGPIVYGLCHRFDQSAVSLILHKLYQQLHPWVMVDILESADFQRKQTINYFPDNV